MKLTVSGTLNFDLQKDEQAPTLQFAIETKNLTVKGATMVVLATDQLVKCHLTAVDKFGNPAKIEGEPAWNSADSTIVSVASLGQTAPDVWSATVTPVGKTGVTQVTAVADANLDPGVTTQITGFLDVQVSAGEAVAFEMKADAPETAPPAAKKS